MRRGVRMPGFRERLAANRAQLDGLAALTGRPAVPATWNLPPKRERKTVSTEPLERDVSAAVREMAALVPGLTLWRNQRGQVELPEGGRISYGVGPNGASDLIGYRTVTVTPEMVGQPVALFCAVEVKRPGGVLRADQARFIGEIQAVGGIAGVARCAEDVQRILEGQAHATGQTITPRRMEARGRNSASAGTTDGLGEF